MKNYLLFFLVLISSACNHTTQTQTKQQVSTTPHSSIDKEPVPAEATTIPENGEQTFYIQVGQVGGIKKGMIPDELYILFDSTRIKQQRDKFRGYTFAIYQESVNPVITCTSPNGKSIEEILIQGTAYKTGKGIGVGNTFADLTKVYHVAKVEMDKELQIYVWVEELQKKLYRQGKEEISGIRFKIGVDASGLMQKDGSVPASAIPPDAKIVAIRL